MTVERGPGEIREMLSEHLDVLVHHCLQFDSGKEHFASEIAVNLRVLLAHHPQSRSHSLLELAGLGEVEFADTAKSFAKGDRCVYAAPFAGLVRSFPIELPTGLEQHWGASLLIPHEEFPLLKSKFSVWWEATLAIDDDGSKFSRRRVIKGLANNDRGAHVSPGLERAYGRLTRANSYPSYVGVSDGMGPEAQTTWASNEGSGIRMVRSVVRQIAHEVVLTLANEQLMGEYHAKRSYGKPVSGAFMALFMLVQPGDHF